MGDPQDGGAAAPSRAFVPEKAVSTVLPPVDPMDDFMSDDMDGDAWSAPRPVRVTLPDFDEDFMADHDDRMMDRPETARHGSGLVGTAPDRDATTPMPDEVESADKIKKARRSRKKAAES